MAPKSAKNPQGRDLLGHKAAADSAADKKAAYDAALQHEKDLKAIADAARATADAKKAAFTQARADYNLPNDKEYERMHAESIGATKNINQDKQDPAYRQVTEDEGHAKSAATMLDNAKKAATKAQKAVDQANADLADAQKALDDAKAAQKANTDPSQDGVFAARVVNAQ